MTRSVTYVQIRRLTPQVQLKSSFIPKHVEANRRESVCVLLCFPEFFIFVVIDYAMARNEASQARRCVPVRGERRPRGRSPIVMRSPLVPSSGVGTQPGWILADDLQDVHQPMCMDLQQPRGSNFDVLTLAEQDAPQRLESVDIGAANLQTVFPLETFGNQAPESFRALPFQSDRSLASVVLSPCGAGNPNSNVLTAPRIGTPPTASGYHFLASPFLKGPEVIIPLPEILPLEEAENVDMLDQSLLPPEQDQSLENYASSLPTPRQLDLHPNHLEGTMPLPMVSYDIPSYVHTNLPLITPLAEMIRYAATHPESFPFGHGHQQSPQQPLIDLDGDMQMQPLLGSAPVQSSPASNEPCPLDCGARYPPSPNSNVIPAIAPIIVEAAPSVNMVTPFHSLQAQAPATSTLPNSAAQSPSANQTNVAAQSVPAGRRGRAPRNRPPQKRKAILGKSGLREITAASPATTVNVVADVVLGRIETQRQKHMKSERQKRKVMNELYAAMRSFLPPAAMAKKIRPDNATVVQEMINSIKRKKNELKGLEQKLKRSQRLVAALCNVNQRMNRYRDTTAAQHLTTKGYTTLPAVESYLGLGYFSGTNVAINYCHSHYSFTVTSPYLRQAVALLEPMLIAIQNHCLEVLFASIMTTSNTYTVYYLQCKASPDMELLRNNLLIVLQDIVNDFPWTFSSNEHHG